MSRATGKSRAEEALERFHEEEDPERVYDYRLLWQLWPFVRGHRAHLGGALVLLVVMAAFGLWRPLIMRAALDGFQAPGGADRLTAYGLLLAFVILVEQLLAFPQLYWVQLAGARAMAELRGTVFRFLHRCGLAFFDRTPIGRLVTRVTNDVDAIGEMFASGALNAVGDLLRLVVIVVILLWLDWRLSLFAFAVVPPIGLFVEWTRRGMRTAYRDVRTRTARINAFLNEQVSGITVVQAYAREDKSEAEFDAINLGYREANMRAIVLESGLDAAIEMVGSACIAAILWYAGARRLETLSFGTLFAFVAYIEMFFLPIRNLSARYTQIQSAMAGIERVLQLLDRAPDAAEGSEPAAAATDGAAGTDPWGDDGELAFELDRVTFAYRPGTPVLHDIRLTARRGEVIALVGATGSGKTTIASLLLRLYEPQQGTVRVLGRDVRSLDRTLLRRRFAVVPQDVFLFPGTVAENVAAGEPEPDRARVRAVLERIGVLDLLEAREGGIDAVVQERGKNFSAGERQLIALSRALYRDPAIVVLDEPTSNIDSDTELRLQRAMDAAMAGRTAILIAHRLSTIRAATRIVVLSQGRIIEQGGHAELMAQDGVYARLYRLQDARRALAKKVEELAAAGE